MTQEIKENEIITNTLINKRQLKNLIYHAFLNYGIVKSSVIADRIKNLTFHYATKSGISLSIEDLRVPKNKSHLIGLTNSEVEITRKNYNIGNITSIERFQKTIDTWNNANNFLKDEILTYFRESDPLNPLYIMAFSGARGNISQVRQLVGMRGLMSDPQGQIIDLPIRSNFREGLNVTEYIISSYGARKGLVDTAIRTADSGYLTRRLVDVAQDIIVRENDCQTTDGIRVSNVSNNELLIGRLLADSIYSTDKQLIAARNTEINENLLQTLTKINYKKLKVRSPLTCNSLRSVCQNCYGWHLAYSKIVDLGEAVGIIAAQSIGEPGTQLTMRTFHTGGVFSGDLTDQIRVPFKGTIKYKTNFKAALFRTIHGNQGFRLHNPLVINIENVVGTRVTFFLNSGSTLLVNNNQKVFKNQIIAEATKETTLIVEKEQKDIYAEETGEIFFQNVEIQTSSNKSDPNNFTTSNKTAGLIWILQGKLYNIVNNAYFQPKLGTEINTNISLTKENICNLKEGIVNLNNLNKKNEIQILNFFLTLNNLNCKLETEDQFILFKTINGSFKKFKLEVKNNQILKQNEILATLNDNLYETQTGGFITYSIEESRTNKKKKNIKKIFSGYFYWVPEETYLINPPLVDLKKEIQSGLLIQQGTEILQDTFSKTSGLLQINNLTQELTIKPGELFNITDLDTQFLPKSGQFIKPGDFIVPKKVIAQRLTYIELIKTEKNTYLLARPVVTYSIPKVNPFSVNHIFFPANSEKYFRIKIVKKFLLKNWEKISSSESVNLLQTFLILDLKNKEEFLTPKIEFIPDLNTKEKNYKVRLSLYETINLNDNKKLNKNLEAKIRPLVSHNQYIYANTTIACIEQYPRQKELLVSTKNNTLSQKQVLVLEENNIKKIDYSEVPLKNLKVSVGKLIRVGTLLSDNIKSPYSGQILKIENNTITVRLGKPYLISGGTILRSVNRQLIKKRDIIATLVYEKLKTTDIIQGLPKVEEILEARKIKNSCVLAPCPGYIFFRTRLNIIELYSLQNEKITIPLDSNTTTNFSNNNKSFVEVGEPLTEGVINPHLKLKVLFDYYKTLYPLNEACRRSFKKLQLFLVSEIQKTYQAQGVQISDKHIEIIVKQMTSRVYIENSGYTTFLPGEIVDFKKIETITNIAITNNEIPPSYNPILLGITKASLNSDSFISAASFQETTRVLTEAAIEGKKDWLNGLKENVIIGRLIPAGTGFNHIKSMEILKREKNALDLNMQNKLEKIKLQILNLRLNNSNSK